MNPGQWMISLGNEVQLHRKRAGLTQIQLASLAGVGKTVVYDLEKGKVTLQVETMLKILHVLNIDLEWTSPTGAVPHA